LAADAVFKRSMTLASIPTLLLASTTHLPDIEGLAGIEVGLFREDAMASTGAAGSPRSFLAWDAVSFAADSSLVRDHPKSFAVRLGNDSETVVDPRVQSVDAGKARLRTSAPDSWPLIADTARQHLAGIKSREIAGIVLYGARSLDKAFLSALADAIRDAGLSVLVEAAGLDDARLFALRGKADGFVLASANHSVADLLALRERLRIAGPLLLDFAGCDIAVERVSLVDGVIAGDLSADAVGEAADLLHSLSGFGGIIRSLSGPSAPVAAILRGNAPDWRLADEALLILFNRAGRAVPANAQAVLSSSGGAFSLCEPPDSRDDTPLEPGAHRIYRARRDAPILGKVWPASAAAEAARRPRLVVEALSPRVEVGDFPVKRVVGENVTVEAVLYGDGHEQLAAELQWRALDEDDWHVVRMEQLPNDGWRAALTLDRLGRHEFAVEGWLDRFGGFRRDFSKKRDAGVALAIDYREGRLLAEHAVARADRDTAESITRWCARYDAAGDDEERAALLLASDIADLMDVADDRPHRIRSAVQSIDAERIEARFSSWYELFPRSITDDKAVHGTFRSVIDRLPAIRAMGFDTLYFPPIHPIGKTNRKGPNNTLTPGPDDVGSPYAIGSAEGGHEALHPALGSFDDFHRLVAAAAGHGLEIAIDFAIQCSPDHPWLTEHPGWFAWRSDGSMKYAENPPKKYQDIVNVDFYGPDAIPDLWLALRDIVLLWVGHGVKTFRVDNPHTKPLPFWEWMIGDVRARHPDAIFLAEAFTRPNMMYRLAKIGFSQSYTYFTWRNGKQELADYITELTTTEPREFYRPHLFVNTPDINPPYLQTSGRAGFRIRAVLAATLSGLFGVYSGFELCEAAPIPGKEEYLDSEKYEIRPRDWQAPGNIIADISLLNGLRRAHAALQTHLNTRFYTAHSDSIIYYGKPAPDGSDLILVMVNLDPLGPQEASFEVPLWEFGLPDDGSVSVEDLAHGHRFDWHGKDQWIRVDPQEPYRIWRIWSAS
jgi:starch synthase (maltosyl-transferring)